jgi:hypothetical protein
MDLLRVSHADAVDDDADNGVHRFNMFTVRQVMAKEIVVISPTCTIRDTALIEKTNFMLCLYAKVNFGRDDHNR